MADPAEKSVIGTRTHKLAAGMNDVRSVSVQTCSNKIGQYITATTGAARRLPIAAATTCAKTGGDIFFYKNEKSKKNKEKKQKKHGLPARSTARLDLPRVPPRGVRLEGRVLQMRQVATASSSYHPRRRLDLSRVQIQRVCKQEPVLQVRHPQARQ